MSDRNGIVKTVNTGYYLVAFIGIVGQRDRLKQWVKLPGNDEEKEDTVAFLEASGAGMPRFQLPPELRQPPLHHIFLL
jgi:hypothetical protein